MTWQAAGHLQHTVKIGVQPAVLGFAIRVFEGLLDDILGKNCLTAMRPIPRRVGLEIETQGVSALVFVRLESSQLTDLLPGHHPILLESLSSSFLEFLAKVLSLRRRAPHLLASPLNRFAYRLRMPARDGRNFRQREAFDAIQKKCLAISSVDTTQG